VRKTLNETGWIILVETVEDVLDPALRFDDQVSDNQWKTRCPKWKLRIKSTKRRLLYRIKLS